MKTMVFGILWASAHNAIWFVGYAVLVGLLVYSTRRLFSSVRLLVARRWQAVFLPGFSSTTSLIKSVLLGVGFLGLFVALLQPQWGKKEHKVEQEGRELLVALDISRSMMAADVKPNRLAFAKSKIKQLVKLLGAERVGLLVFSGDAFIQCPLTRDTAAFSLFLDNVDAETISSGTTSLAQAISKAMSTFASLPTRKNKILVIFTDGEDFSTGLSQIKEDAKKVGLHIFTYGVGTEEGAPIPLVSEEGIATGYQKDESDKVVFSRLNRGILQALSRESGGKYIDPTQDAQDLQSLVSHVARYEKEKFEDKDIELEEERYPYFLAVSFLCFLVEWVL
jgi:Ca-activated chloride channel family protein